MTKPIAFDENVKGIDRFWQPEEWDDLVPPPGFISDFVLMTRGVETPTKLSIWTAIWTLSSALKREVWLEWYPSPLYPNFFVILVGPPKIVAKSTAAKFGEKILSRFHEFIDDPLQKVVKEVNLLRSKATPESLSIALAPKKLGLINPETGEAIQIDRGSQLSIVVSELATFLGKQKYQGGLIDRLTDLYDCKDEDDELTIGRGYNKFFNIYFTLLGATTPQHLETSIPEEAFGGGFMSRTVLVYQQSSTRDFPTPKAVPGGPDIKEMQKRLAWIAETCQGEYVLSKEAHDYYNVWYVKYKKDLAKEANDPKSMMKHRYDLHLLKLALILRAQEYNPGRVIELRHLKNSERLLEATFNTAKHSIQNVGASRDTQTINRVREVLVKHERRTRRQLLTSLSPYGVTAVMLNDALSYLQQCGFLRIRRDGKDVPDPSSSGSELYEWRKEYGKGGGQ